MNLSSLKANIGTTVSGGLVAVSGLLTFVSGFADQLGKLGAIIPPKYRQNVLLAGGVATAASMALHGVLTKSASVTGNGTVNDPVKVDQGDGTNKTLAPVIIGFLLCGLFFQGCRASQDSPLQVALMPGVLGSPAPRLPSPALPLPSRDHGPDLSPHLPTLYNPDNRPIYPVPVAYDCRTCRPLK